MPQSGHAYESRPDLACILVLPTTHHTLLAEEILQSENIRYTPIPKPQKAVSECGMALQIRRSKLAQAAKALKKMEVKFFLRNANDEIESIGLEDIEQGE
jgi:hypothetical protein